MQEDPKLRSEIRAGFGEESYDSQGVLNRRFLAEKVFGSAEQVTRINQIVHPYVFRAFEQHKVDAERDGAPLLIQEAALIYESGADRMLDAVAVVDASPDARVERVAARDGTTPQQVLTRMKHQLPPDELRRRADVVIENNGSHEDLRRQVEMLYQRLVSP